jgi:hypothetical protein
MDNRTGESDRDHKMVSAQFPARLVFRLAELARANERSFSAELRRAAAGHLERERSENE